MAGKLKVTQVKSTISHIARHRATVRALGLRGIGKAGEVPESIRKGVEDAKKNLIRIPMVGTTIPHEVQVA